MAVTGNRVLTLARQHLGERYILGTLVPKNNSRWTGPWDCAEFVSWLAFQLTNQLRGCGNNAGDPATADAWTGFWARDAAAHNWSIPVEQAAGIPGAAVLRNPGTGAIGHIAISDGGGGTVEAHSTRRGVIESTVSGRRWDAGVLIPGIDYAAPARIDVTPPRTVIYRLTSPPMTGSIVRDIQRALTAAGFHPGGIDGSFGPMTHAAVVAFQASRGLIADGEVGAKTARALGIALPPA